MIELTKISQHQQLIISQPVESVQGEISIPGDKSISQRALMLGALSGGETIIEGL